MLGMMNSNTQMSRFSLSYIEAVASHVGFQVVETKVDHDSVDGVLISDVGRRPRVEFQAKATARDLVMETHIHFPLTIKRVCEKGLNLHEFLMGSGSAILLMWGYEQKTLSQRFDRRPVGRISPLAAAKQTQGPSSDRGLAGSSKWRSICAARRHTLAHDAP